ncbi:MAG: hypothetical protein U1E53_13095 [Dongiaceae bacterium]
MAGLLSGGQRRGLLASGYSAAGDAPPTILDSVPQAAALAAPVWDQAMQQPVDWYNRQQAQADAEWYQHLVAQNRGRRELNKWLQGKPANLAAGGADDPLLVNAAMGFMPGALLAQESAAAAGLESVASRSARLYNPPARPPRSFAADYPAGAQADAAGNLAHTIDGDPIVARWVVGRQVAGQPDVPFPQAELDALTEAGTGRRAALVPSRETGGDAGRTLANRISGRPEQVLLRRDLTPEQLSRTHAHENGHVVGKLAGNVDKAGAVRQFREVYNDINNPNVALRRSQQPGFDPRAEGVGGAYRNYGPEQQGYLPHEVPAELDAEAIRAYLTDPNYLKTVAPKVAAALRKTLNTDPVVSRIIQLNSLGWLPFAAGTAASGGLLGSDRQQ